MVLPKIRMKIFHGRLAMIRTGDGAAIMSPGVKRVAMVFSAQNTGGNMGARKFWQNYLPSLKYYNPAVVMDVVRTAEAGGPPTLTIEFESADKVTFDLKDKDRVDIYSAVLEATKATLVPTSEEDNQKILLFDAFKKRMVQRIANRKARIEAAKVAGRTMNISPLVQ